METDGGGCGDWAWYYLYPVFFLVMEGLFPWELEGKGMVVE